MSASSVRGYMVKFQHKPTSLFITLFETADSVGQAYDNAVGTLSKIMLRDHKNTSDAEPNDPQKATQIMRRWEAVSVSCVDVEVQ